jgi:peptidoglycan/xylan/chitin deacetylase (PgdA/CDA1 family)
MRIKYAGVIVIAVLILIGAVILLPIYFQQLPRPTVMLTFNIINNENIPKWCIDLASILQKHAIKATVFITGELAESYPNCVTSFSSKNTVDIGSSTYNYSDLAPVSDYSKSLEEIKSGKITVDNIGEIDSKVFRAPDESTDENIYSLLTNSGILADFSYTKQYNKYENGQFIKYDLIAYDGSNSSSLMELSKSLPSTKKPIMVNFDNSVPVNQIDSFIESTKSKVSDVDFTNASELTDLVLTVRKNV